MGFNKLNLPEVDILLSIRQRMSDDNLFFKRYWTKPDAIFGSSDSFQYMKENFEIYEKQQIREKRNP
jgi:hypothetical protein